MVAATLFAAAPAFAVRKLVGRRATAGADDLTRPPADPDRPRGVLAVVRGNGPDGAYAGASLLAGMAVTVGISWLTVVLAFGPVETISPTYDAVHHYNAVAWILSTGDASSLTLRELTIPGQPAAYPAAWHDLVSLVVLTAGVSVPAASNLLALSVAGVVWPLSCVLLVRQVLGRRGVAFLVAPILATAFTAMPWMVMTWGVLWPNLLGLALVPAGLAAVVTVLGLARDPAFGVPGALLLGAVALPAIALAHPNAAVSLLVIGVSVVLVAAAAAAIRAARGRQVGRAVTVVTAALGVALAVLWLLAWSPFLAGVRAFDWPASLGLGEAARGVLFNSMNQRPELLLISALVVLGAVFALRSPATAWLVLAHLTSGFLYVLAVSQEGALTAALTGAWYNDSYRIAAMVPITGVPLATLGLVGTTGLLVRAVIRIGRAEPSAQREQAVTTAAVVVVAAALVLVSGGFRIGMHAFTVAQTYQREAGWMLQPGQRDFLEEAGRILPPDAVVAANPWTGNALLFAFTGRHVMFPHLSGRWTPDQRVIQERLHDAESDPAVCPAVRATGLTHAIDGPVSYWPWDSRSHSFPGITGLDRTPGFEPVLTGGGSTLYRVTACDPDRTGAG
ncbi:hypothetical protein GCM10009613_37310 [Pseudonocardia kongjuensis]|uniref:Integral membrane protein n=1 Tax=Pseudonocardia kongjuensis TaxID=102227 RepID=A0ABN1XXS3_9PSEU